MDGLNPNILFFNGSVQYPPKHPVVSGSRRAYRTGLEYNKIKDKKGYKEHYNTKDHEDVESKLISINKGHYMTNDELKILLNEFVNFLKINSGRDLKRNRSVGITFLEDHYAQFETFANDYTIESRISKSKFSQEEDNAIISAVEKHGTNNWAAVARDIPNRNARQCRDRWENYLNPELPNSNWRPEEDEVLISTYKEIGPQWDKISQYLHGRSAKSVENRFKTLENESPMQVQSNVTEAPKDNLFEDDCQNNVDDSAIHHSDADADTDTDTDLNSFLFDPECFYNFEEN